MLFLPDLPFLPDLRCHCLNPPQALPGPSSSSTFHEIGMHTRFYTHKASSQSTCCLPAPPFHTVLEHRALSGFSAHPLLVGVVFFDPATVVLDSVQSRAGQ